MSTYSLPTLFQLQKPTKKSKSAQGARAKGLKPVILYVWTIPLNAGPTLISVNVWFLAQLKASLATSSGVCKDTAGKRWLIKALVISHMHDYALGKSRWIKPTFYYEGVRI